MEHFSVFEKSQAMKATLKGDGSKFAVDFVERVEDLPRLSKTTLTMSSIKENLRIERPYIKTLFFVLF